jgi:hypothetical protein
MAHTKVTVAGNGNVSGDANTYSYSGSFDVFKATEVVARLNNVDLTYTTSTINESASPREYTVNITAKTIHIGGGNLGASDTVIIQPVTDMGAPTPRATYTPGASINAADLNNNQTQLMRKALEYDDQKLSSTGGTMTGNLEMGANQTIIFEGATDDAYETTLTVQEPTADRTITIPNVTGTIVTTGNTAIVTAQMMGADSVDSSELVDGSIDTSHIGDAQVTNQKLGSGSVTSSKMAANSVTTTAIADSQVTTAKIADNSISNAKMKNNSVSNLELTDNAVNTAEIQAGAVTTAKIAADAVTGAKIADDAIDSEHYTDASIDTAHITDANITTAKLATNAVTTAKITDGNVTTDKLAADSVTIAKIGCEQTTISDSDNHVPTSGAVVDYVASIINPIGGLEVIADDESFPNTIPVAGVVISITDAAGLSVNSSGVSTNGDALDNSTITINGFPSELRGGVGTNANPYVFQSGAGLMVVSTGSSHTYNYHQAMIREADFVQLSDDINEFNNRYRIHAGEPSSNNDDGDMVWDTNANKMKVYDSTASAWKEVTSTGDFKFLVAVDAGTTTAASYDGSDTSFDLKETTNSGSAASISNINQLIVSLNGVIQKPNTGTYDANEEGFYLTDTDTIRFCTAPPTNSTSFILQCGSAVSIPTPGDGTVTAAKIASGAVTQAKIAKPIDLDDNEQIRFGTGNDLKISHSGTSGIINNDTGNLYIQNAGSNDDSNIYIRAKDGEDSILCNDDGAVELYHDAIKTFKTDPNGVQILGPEGGSANLFLYGDEGDDNNDKFVFIANDGELTLQNYTSGSWEKNIECNGNGNVELYYDNTKRLETTDSGIQITGQSRGVCTQNLIINGAMQIDQRNAGAAYTGAAAYTLDRWYLHYLNGNENPTVVRHDLSSANDAAPWAEGFRQSLHITNGDQTSTDADDYLGLRYHIEARDIRNCGWDFKSTSSFITLSFWVKSSVAQNFYGYLRSQDGTAQRYRYETGSLSANTWTKITKVIPGDSDIEVTDDNEAGFSIFIHPFWGTNFTSAGGLGLNNWGPYNGGTRTPDYTTTWWTTNNATFEVTGFQLEVGKVANAFKHETYADELLKCQRYFYKTYNHNHAPGTSTDASSVFGRNYRANAITQNQLTVTYPVQMRATPTTVTAYAAHNGSSAHLSTGSSNPPGCNTELDFTTVQMNGARGFSGVQTGSVDSGDFYGGHFTADAEL